MNMQAVFFDLDGTLVDTARDFAHCINILLARKNKSPVGYNEFRAQVHADSNGMIQYAFNITHTDPTFKTLRQEFLDLYYERAMQKAVLFDGMAELLDELGAQKIPWGIITNKPTLLTKPIIDFLKFNDRAACVVCGDTLAQCKPHPAPLLFACESVNVKPENVVYVGDLETDIVTAKNAGTKSILVTFGYHPAYENRHQWGADAVVASAHEVMSVIKKL